MVWRLEKTDRSDMLVGHDWIFSVSANGDADAFQPNSSTVRMRQPRAHLPVISLTVLKIFSFSGSSGGTLL